MNGRATFADFQNPRKSSGHKEGVLLEDLRITWKRPAVGCQARIKITCSTATNRVRIERLKDTPDHCHSIDESGMRKRSKFIKDMVAEERLKITSLLQTSLTLSEKRLSNI